MQKERNSEFLGGTVNPSLKNLLVLEAARADRSIAAQLRFILRKHFEAADKKQATT